MKDKLPSYEFKVGEECWCWNCAEFTTVTLNVPFSHVALDCGRTFIKPHRPLTIAEAKLLGLEPPKKTKKVTMWQILYRDDLDRYFLSDALYENEEHARCQLHCGEIVKLVNPIEIEMEE